MTGPVYAVRVTIHGALFIAPVKAIPLLGHYWAVGYITPTGRHRKLTVKGNSSVLTSEEDCIDRLKRIAAERGWKDWPADKEEKCYPIC